MQSAYSTVPDDWADTHDVFLSDIYKENYPS